VSLYPNKIAVWVAIFGKPIIWLTINAQKTFFLGPFIKQLVDVEVTNGCFQQDLATAHTTPTAIK
jgi:hypothetical protein